MDGNTNDRTEGNETKSNDNSDDRVWMYGCMETRIKNSGEQKQSTMDRENACEDARGFLVEALAVALR